LCEKSEDTAVDADEADEVEDALELVLDSTVTGDSPPEICCRHHFRDFWGAGLLAAVGSSLTFGKGTCRATGLRDIGIVAAVGGACLPGLGAWTFECDAANVEKSTLMRELGRSKASSEKECVCAIVAIIVPNWRRSTSQRNDKIMILV
jgi:hypothetical protein